MRALVLVPLVLVVVGWLIWSYVVAIATARSPQRNARNHQQMARWIDNLFLDDDVRPLISADQQEKGRDLLADYYKEKPQP